MIENRLQPPVEGGAGGDWDELARRGSLALPPTSTTLPPLLAVLGRPNPILLVWCLNLVTAASSSLPSAHASSSSLSTTPPPLPPTSPLRRPAPARPPPGTDGVDADALWPGRDVEAEADAVGGEVDVEGWGLGDGLDVSPSLGWFELAEARRR